MSGIAGFMFTPGGTDLAVTATPPSLFTGSRVNPFTTPSVTAIVSGGSGNYSYNWEVVDASAGVVTITAPTHQSTTFRINLDSEDGSFGVFRCTVIDTSRGGSAFVDVTFSHSRRFV